MKENGPDLLSILADPRFVDEDMGSSEYPIQVLEECYENTTPTSSTSNICHDYTSSKRKLEDQFSTSDNLKKMKSVVKVEKE